jgi:hypothetical protein
MSSLFIATIEKVKGTVLSDCYFKYCYHNANKNVDLISENNFFQDIRK